jgi:hypothetical protein
MAPYFIKNTFLLIFTDHSENKYAISTQKWKGVPTPHFMPSFRLTITDFYKLGKWLKSNY